MKRIHYLRLCQFTVPVPGHRGHWLHSLGYVLRHLHSGRGKPSHLAGANSVGPCTARGHWISRIQRTRGPCVARSGWG